MGTYGGCTTPEHPKKKTIGRVLLGLPGLFISLSGAMFLLAPTRAAEKLLLSPQGIEGLSNMRAFVGAPVLAAGIAILIGAATCKLENARGGALFVVLLLVARLVSLGLDGMTPGLAVYITVPAVVLAMMVAGHKLIDLGVADQSKETA